MKLNKSSGKVSTILLVLAVITIIAIVTVFIVTNLNKGRTKKPEAPPSQFPEEPNPVYDVTLGDIRFVLLSSQDLGDILKATYLYQQDLTSTERFIKVVIGAQNKGKVDTLQGAWDLGSIIDSEGRNFIQDYRAYPWLPTYNFCNAILKPEFEPIPCTKIYEVSKASKNLKIEVKSSVPKSQKALMDLKVTP